ncbi:MAG: sugar kinase [Paucibacter sp.]|nr:sugar kinase [Roseateles sp.]
MTLNSTLRVALLGECMLELQGRAVDPAAALGSMQLGFGGDTLNTAVYLARCAPGFEVSYATALGDDAFSAVMMQRWAEEGIALDLVRRLPGRMPGLYMIEVDEAGERRFSYWRDSAAARAYFELPSTPLEARAQEWGAFYLSGISLAILPPAARERVFELMQSLRRRGVPVIFDNNFRPRLWPDRAQARACYERAFELSTTALITAEDHQALLGLPTLAQGIEAAKQLPSGELVIKQGAEPTLVREGGALQAWQQAATQPVERVVDTTAAGDSFAAGYLARRLAGASAVEAARFGNRVAARVIQHPGALIPRTAMADLMG